jgi:hypothetical protein
VRFVLEGLTERVRLIEVVRERVTVGDRVNGFVVAIALLETVWVGDRERLTEVVIDRVNGFVVGIADRDTV